MPVAAIPARRAIASSLQFAAALLAVLIGSTSGAQAQPYPSRSVTLVVAFTPGGPSDVLSRIIGRKLEEALGQPLVILNRPGAGGNLAAELVAHSNPDGYTLLMGNNSILATNASLYKHLNFDPQKDFFPIILVGGQPNILVVHPTVPARSVAELVALAKDKPGSLNYASSGHGAAAHLAAELFKAQAHVDIAHVPYKGSAPALQDLISGQVHMMFATSASVIELIRSGTVRPLAVTSLSRTGVLPDVPTMAEQGLAGFEATTWHGLVAPAGTPIPIIARLHEATAAALREPGVIKSLADLGVDIAGGTPDDFTRFISAEVPKWTAIVKATGAKLD